MNLLIIGGSGFLSGTHVRVALAQGHNVWAVTRGQRPLPESITPVVVDRKNRADFASVIYNVGNT